MLYNLKENYKEETGESAEVSVLGDDGYETYPTDDYVNWLESFIWKMINEK